MVAAEQERQKRPRTRFLVVGIALALILAGFLITTIHTGNGNSGAPEPGNVAPSFSLPSANGSGRVGPQLTDGRPSVVLFFANWCDVCRQEMPALASAISEQQHSRGPLRSIQVIGVDPLDSAAAARSFIAESKISFPVGLDQNALVTSQDYEFLGPPYAVFIKGSGRIFEINPSTLTTWQLKKDESALVRG